MYWSCSVTWPPEFNSRLRTQRGGKNICLWRPGYVTIGGRAEIIALACILVNVRCAAILKSIKQIDFVTFRWHNYGQRLPIGRPAQAIVINGVRKLPAAYRCLDKLYAGRPLFKIAGDIPQHHACVLTRRRQVTAAGVPDCIPQYAAVPGEHEQWYALDKLVWSRFSCRRVVIVHGGMQKIVKRNSSASDQHSGSDSRSSYEQTAPANLVVLNP